MCIEHSLAVLTTTSHDYWYPNYKHSLFTASSGTVTINADSTVQILAEEAHPLDRFDPQVRHYCTVFRDCLIYI